MLEHLGRDRGDQRPEQEAGDVERREPPEVGADVLRIVGDDDPPDRRPDGAAPEPEQQPREHERPELGGDRTPEHRQRGDEHAARTMNAACPRSA